MSNAIRFLEVMGSKPQSVVDYAAAVASLEIEGLQRQALLERNHAALNDLLGGRAKVFFGVFAPEDQPTPNDEQPAEGEPDDVPSESIKLS